MSNKNHEDFKPLEELDNFSGPLTDPEAYEDLDMLAIRNYMKKHSKKGPLAEEELNQFRRS